MGRILPLRDAFIVPVLRVSVQLPSLSTAPGARRGGSGRLSMHPGFPATRVGLAGDQEHLPKLFARGHDRAGSYRKFLDCIFISRSPAHRGIALGLLTARKGYPCSRLFPQYPACLPQYLLPDCLNFDLALIQLREILHSASADCRPELCRRRAPNRLWPQPAGWSPGIGWIALAVTIDPAPSRAVPGMALAAYPILNSPAEGNFMAADSRTMRSASPNRPSCR